MPEAKPVLRREVLPPGVWDPEARLGSRTSARTLSLAVVACALMAAGTFLLWCAILLGEHDRRTCPRQPMVDMPEVEDLQLEIWRSLDRMRIDGLRRDP